MAGPDAVLGVPTRFSLGFMLSQEAHDARFGPNEGTFGHPGAGDRSASPTRTRAWASAT